MIRCCPPRPMRWNVATGAIARCNATSIACAHKCRSVRAWRWTCGVKPKPKAVNKPSKHYMRRVQDENNPVSLLQSHNSQENFRLIDTLKLHYVGSIKLCEVKELAEISPQDSRLTPCQTIGLEKTKCFRVTQEIYGKERTMIVTYNQPLFHTQYLTLHNDLAKAITELSLLQ